MSMLVYSLSVICVGRVMEKGFHISICEGEPFDTKMAITRQMSRQRGDAGRPNVIDIVVLEGEPFLLGGALTGSQGKSGKPGKSGCTHSRAGRRAFPAGGCIEGKRT